MNINVGKTDRMVRFILGVVLMTSPLINMPAIWNSALAGYASMIVGAILALTALLGMCPLYSVFGIRTCRNG